MMTGTPIGGGVDLAPHQFAIDPEFAQEPGLPAPSTAPGGFAFPTPSPPLYSPQSAPAAAPPPPPAPIAAPPPYNSPAPPSPSPLSVPDQSPVAAPQCCVEFDLGDAGTITAFYHRVITAKNLVALVYDTRFTYGTRFSPPVGERLFDITVSKVGEDNPQTHTVASIGLSFPLTNEKLAITVLVVQQRPPPATIDPAIPPSRRQAEDDFSSQGFPSLDIDLESLTAQSMAQHSTSPI